MISMLGQIDSLFATHEVKLINYEIGDYNEAGDWEDAEKKEHTSYVNLQPIDRKSVEFLTGLGGTVDVSVTFMLHLNDGNQVYHERSTLKGKIQASKVQAMYNDEIRDFRVVYADNRPWHNYCMAYLEMLKDGKN